MHDSSLLPWEVAQRLVIACAARTTNHPAKRRALRGDLFRVLGVHRLIEGARLALECLGAPLRDKAVVLGEPSVESFRGVRAQFRSEEHTSELKSLMRISYAVFCLKKKTTQH